MSLKEVMNAQSLKTESKGALLMVDAFYKTHVPFSLINGPSSIIPSTEL